MKANKLQMKVLVLCAAVFSILLLSACFSEWRGGDNGTFTISTGGNGRSVLPWDSNVDADDLEYTIQVSGGPGPEQSQTFKGSKTVIFTVTPGRWDISVKAYEAVMDGEVTYKHLKAEGSASVDVKPGRNDPVVIQMVKPYTEEIPVTVKYTIIIETSGSAEGDTVTASSESGDDGDTITLNYTVANTAKYNLLEFSGVIEPIESVSGAESGEREYTINAEDSEDGVITIRAAFTHTNLEIDPIAFNDESITKTYGDAAFTNAITSGHKGEGAITYSSSDETVATVDSSGQVTIRKAGSAVITAEKEADDTYAYAKNSYTLTVNRKPVTITGLSVAVKTYDGNTTATASGTAVISGKVDDDDVMVSAGTANFADKNVGNGKNVNFTNYTLSGEDAGNYSLSAQPASVTANIAAKPVTIIGLTADSKVYNGNTAATASGNAAISGKVDGDDVMVSAGTAAFTDKNVGNGKNVNFTNYTLSGADAGNYSLSAQPASVTANITAKPVTITGLSAANKVYDGTTTATVSGSATINGAVSGDTVTVNMGNAVFVDKNVGDGKSVIFTLSGADAGNYSLSQPAVTANITPATYIITKSGSNFTAARGGTSVTTNSVIQTVINEIKTNADGNPLTIQFGNGSDVLDIGGGESILINFTSGWGLITLTGKLTSDATPGQDYGIIRVSGVSIDSKAELTLTSITQYYVHMIYVQNLPGETGTLTISGGKISATTSSTDAVYINNQTVTITGGTVSATSGRAVYNGGTLTITGGTVSATTGTAVSGGTVTITGGDVSATTGTAVSGYTVNITGGTVSATTGIAMKSGGVGKITVSENAKVTSSNTSYGTIYIPSNSSADASTEVLEITGGTVENISTGTTASAIYNDSIGRVKITGGTVKTTASSGNYAVNNNSTGTVNIIKTPPNGATIIGNTNGNNINITN